MALIVQEGEQNYNEEGEDRNEYHIDLLAQNFTSAEKSIRHDVYPENDGEAEETSAERVFTHLSRGDGTMYRGQKFYNGIAFKECVLDYALHHGYNLKQYRYDKDKIGISIVVSRMVNVRCSKSQLLLGCFLITFERIPEYYMPAKMEEIIKKWWSISASMTQCQAARRKALEWIEVQYDLQFARICDYAAEIFDANVDFVVEVDPMKNYVGEDLFNRFYVCFDVLRKTWKQTCRPLVGVDRCFLKSKTKEQLLVVIGRDADNGIYMIAWSVVQVENTKNWLWFVKRLKNDLELNDGDGYIMVSDQQKELIKAVELELPKIEYRICVRHIYVNLKKNHPSKLQMKPLIWNLAWSYNKMQLQERLERIHSHDTQMYDDVMKSNPKSLYMAFYKINNYCEDVKNNSTELFNKIIN